MRATPRPAPASTLAVVGDDTVTLDTGVARFVIDRHHFDGISAAWLDQNEDGSSTGDGERVLAGGGPFWMREDGVRFGAVYDDDVEVNVEEQGPLRATVRARGWYESADGERQHRFATYVTATSGSAELDVVHRTILTHPESAGRVADLGWEWSPSITAETWRVGIDGEAVSGPVPAQGESVYLHQYRADAVRLRRGGAANAEIAAGVRADGWASIDADVGITVALRDIWQRFPKELEITNDPTAPGLVEEPWRPQLVIHAWPKHGLDAFSQSEELRRDEIAKLRWAHEGALMDLRAPQVYLDELQRLATDPGPDQHWDVEQQIAQADAATGQGVAITTRFAIWLHPASVSAAARAEFASLHQHDPHALVEPQWLADSGVEERLAAREPARYPQVEALLDRSYPAYHDYVVDAAGEYGMWIYANVHNSWYADRDVPSLHRVWQVSHYRNVFAGWLHYQRSGLPGMLSWARANTDLYADVGIVSHDLDGSALGQGGTKGSIYHCKGFMPWASAEVAPAAHWTDATAFTARYLLSGDLLSRDLYRMWHDGWQRWGAASNHQTPKSCAEWSNVTYLREHLTPLGELVRVYQVEHDPQALLLMHEITRGALDIPFECTLEPSSFPVFHDHWYWRYWEQTRDPRVRTRFIDWAAAGYDNPSINAFLYHITGETAHLTEIMPLFYDDARLLYQDPQSRYDGYTVAQNNSQARWLQQAPYYLQALTDADLLLTRGTRRSVYPYTNAGHNWTNEPRPPAGWPNAALVGARCAR
ncbi:MAG: hypothetical protein HC927_06160, partial [Deltaproteobacteria bacterium]|nr:hypothetical protein [Deltaproteobacteria bacterium]